MWYRKINNSVQRSKIKKILISLTTENLSSVGCIFESTFCDCESNQINCCFDLWTDWMWCVHAAMCLLCRTCIGIFTIHVVGYVQAPPFSPIRLLLLLYTLCSTAKDTNEDVSGVYHVWCTAIMFVFEMTRTTRRIYDYFSFSSCFYCIVCIMHNPIQMTASQPINSTSVVQCWTFSSTCTESTWGWIKTSSSSLAQASNTKINVIFVKTV